MRPIRVSTGGMAAVALAFGMAVTTSVAAQAPPGANHDAQHPDATVVQNAPAPSAPAPEQPPPRPGMPGAAGCQGGPMQGMPMQGMPCPGGAQGGMPGMMGDDMGQMMPMMQGMMGRQGGMAGPGAIPALRHVEGQLAFYRTELHVTEAQVPQWNAFADAVRASAEKLRMAYAQAMQPAGQPDTAPTLLKRRATILSALLDATQRVAAAMDPLYAALSEEQKHTADELMAGHLRGMRMSQP